MPGLSASQTKINVALHAQSQYSRHGFVAGSEITTRGIAAALASRADVNTVRVFAPFSYDGLQDTRCVALLSHAAPCVPPCTPRTRCALRAAFCSWDLVVTEGWTGPLPAFIGAVRRGNPFATVLHMCVDTYPTPQHALQLDVDAYLTNSEFMHKHVLSMVAPTAVMQLAVDSHNIRRTAAKPEYT